MSSDGEVTLGHNEHAEPFRRKEEDGTTASVQKSSVAYAAAQRKTALSAVLQYRHTRARARWKRRSFVSH